MKKTLLILSPALVVFGMLYGLFKYFEKDIEHWVLGQVSLFSEQNLPVRIGARSFDFQFFPPSLRLEDLEIQAKDPAEFGFDQFEIENLRVHLDFIQALGGRLYLSSIVIEGLDLDLNIDALIKDDNKGPEALDWDPFFKLLKKIPVYRLALIRNNLDIESEKLGFDIESKDSDVRIFNQKHQLNIKMDLNSSSLKSKQIPKLDFDLRTDLSILPQRIEIHELELNSSLFKFQGHGEITDLRELARDPQGNLFWKIDSNLALIKKSIATALKVPELGGSLQAQGHVDLKKQKNIQSEFEISGQQVSVEGFQIGDFTVRADLKDQQLKVTDVHILHPSGLLDLSNLLFDFEDFKKISFKGKISTEAIDVHDLLASLKIGDLPLEAFVEASLNCEGPLYPKPLVTCQGEAGANEVEVRSGEGSKSIIAQINEFHATGSVKISDESVSYTANLKVQDDQGRSEGEIRYKDGFKISFSTPRLQFKNIQNLANLKLEGEGQIQGQTWGDSSHGLFSLNLDLKKVFFEDFFLGDPKASVKYQNGIVLFDQVTGSLNSSRYSARIELDVNKSEIKVDAQAPALELADLVKAVERKAVLPVSISGLGSAFVRASGPLSLGQLTYSLSLQSYRGQVAGETFDRLQADLSAIKGEVKTEKVLLAKNKSLVSVFGTAHPNGQIDVSVRGDQFLLEESEMVSKLSSNLSGVLNFQLGLTGFVLSPDVQFRGNLTQLILEEQEFPNSQVQFGVSKKGLEGTASLLGQRLKSEFSIPFSNNDPFHLKVKANDWNYATLFALVGGASLVPEYQTSLTGNLELASVSGGFSQASGHANIDQLILKRGNLSLSNQGPMAMLMKSGQIQLSNFKLTGEQAKLEVKAPAFQMDQLQLQIEAQTPLRLFQIFFPFLEELGGLAHLNVGVTGSSQRPEILGTAQIERGFVKIKSFPHPLERLDAAIQFSARKVLLSKVSANLAGGVLKAEGQIDIEGPKNLPTKISVRADNLNLNIPDGIRTQGSGDLSFSGNWFPFLLSGNFKVNSGLITKEFGGDESTGGLRQSSYLPKVILQNAFEPLLLDLQVDLNRGVAIKNSLMDGSLSGVLQIKGPTGNPSLIGKIVTEKSSKLFFRDKIFEVSTGNIAFRDAQEINPEIYFSARSRVNEYDVSLLAQGSAKSPIIRLTSSPPLSEPDIISLLALGVVKSVADKQSRPGGKTTETDGSTTSLFLDAALNNNDQVKKLKKSLGVDLQISSSYDDTKNASVQRYTLSKKLSDKFNLSTSRIQGSQNSNEVKLRYRIDNNVSAVGTFENRQGTDDPKSQDNLQRDENIFGVDLEYKKEFH